MGTQGRGVVGVCGGKKYTNMRASVLTHSKRQKREAVTQIKDYRRQLYKWVATPLPGPAALGPP